MLKTFLCVCHCLSRFIIMGRIFRELLIVGDFSWCIALLCPMDRAFLVRLLIVPAGFLIVSVDSLIVSGGGIRGRERVIVLSNKNTVFFIAKWAGNANFTNGGKGMRIWRILRILRILRIFLSLVMVCEFWANLAVGGKGMRIRRIRRILRIFFWAWLWSANFGRMGTNNKKRKFAQFVKFAQFAFPVHLPPNS